MVLYPTLAGEIAKRGIKKREIARSIGICDKALSNKLAGKSQFTVAEGRRIQREYFPDIPLDTLFMPACDLDNQTSA